MQKYIYLFAIIFSFIGCEDVIEVDLDTEPPRLTVDAIIRLDTSKSITTATIKVGLSSSFFEQNQAVQVDEIFIENLDYQGTDPLDPNIVVFNEIELGVYQSSKNTDFFTSGALTLTINYKEELYSASTRFVPAVPFDSIIQGDGVLFSGEETEIIVSFTDTPNQADFYIFDFDFNEYLVSEDEFYPGQRFEFSYFYDDIETGTTLNISILGADETFYSYMDQLIVQSGASQGPFQTPVGTVRGNITNITDVANVERADNFALGYFAVVQEYKERITIE
ncbi:DUF4249 domain-containing protein [Maribacter antarcticus]|uniref:DUF4249 family protein n=1 Tax=Maribacter antarcticus TaxID=505250 RepID=UPI00047EDE5E|nr:DUF4249 family protein [Maribacter antarcticus]